MKDLNSQAIKSLITLGFTILPSINLSAATLVGYDTRGMIGTESVLSATTVASGLSGFSLMRGEGLSGVAGANSMNASGWTSEVTDFFSFGFSLNSGYAATFTGFEFSTRSSTFGPGSIGVYAKVDGGVESLIYTINQSPGTNFVSNRFDLSTPVMVNTELGIYLRQIGDTAANGSSITPGGTFRVNDYSSDGINFTDVNLFGDVTAIPEPSAVGLGFLSMATLVLRRQRRVRNG